MANENNGGTTKCANCERQMGIAARRCVYCGAVKGRQCPDCKAVAPVGAKVCSVCKAGIPSSTPNFILEIETCPKCGQPFSRMKFKSCPICGWRVPVTASNKAPQSGQVISKARPHTGSKFTMIAVITAILLAVIVGGFLFVRYEIAKMKSDAENQRIADIATVVRQIYLDI